MEYKYQIIYTSSYDADFDEISNYFINQFKNTELVADLYAKVAARENLLRAFPYAFPLFESNTFTKYEYRTFKVGNYKVFYRIDEIAKVVYIQRILYGGMDLNNKVI